MAVKVLLVCIFFCFTSLTGVRPKIYVKAGELVALHCPLSRGYDHDATFIWTSHTTQEIDLTSNMSAAEQMGMLVHKRSLVIFSASVNHQGDYSCSQGNLSRQFWFRLTVYAPQTREYEERTKYPLSCTVQYSCILQCPDVNTPDQAVPNITSNGIIWHKEGESSPKTSYFSSVEENDHGVYTCTRFYLYGGQTYNMTFTLKLDVQSEKKIRNSVITSPSMGDVFHVDLGSPAKIDCKAVLFSDFDEVFWLTGFSFVETNNSFPVFYNYTCDFTTDEKKMTASLIFQKVTKEDLTKNYTCKLETGNLPSSFVTITLAPKLSPPPPCYITLVLSVVSVVVLMLFIVVIYMKFKINITLFLRDTLGCHSRTSDGKSYDAFLMCYMSETDMGLNEHDRKSLKSVLEESFGYSLCLYDRDVLPGKAVAEAVLDCIEQSRAVVLVPTSSDTCPGSGLLSAIHAALVERQTRLVFIKTESVEASSSDSLTEALQLLGKAGNCVTWKGANSMSPVSSFWKQLRYYLPAPQHAPKTRLLLQTN